ncbi:MAG: GNAT family N-acetyltransferase [Alphaproteobacteria bacterium]|nr:GNAT family N-acetyltransferase [Alphaproteobacteria bacterium]
MACELVSCELAHVELMGALHARCFAEYWDAPSLARLMAGPGTFAFVATNADDNDPLGLIICRVAADECEILTIGVIEDARRVGIGRRLLDAAQARARDDGARRMFLEVGAANTAALNLYQARGYGQVGRRRNYYRTTEREAEDALVLRLDL